MRQLTEKNKEKTKDDSLPLKKDKDKPKPEEKKPEEINFKMDDFEYLKPGI